jgi:hypothetical protein
LRAQVETRRSMIYQPDAWSRSSALASQVSFILDLRRLALAGLPRMWRPEDDFYAFRVRRSGAEAVREGVSRRYTAITAIGLASEAEPDRATALGPVTLRGLVDRLVQDVAGVNNLGDVALTVWASAATGHGDVEAAANRLRRLCSDTGAHPTVEVAWALAALCVASIPADAELRRRLAARLVDSLGPSGVFPHRLGDGGGLRSHVSCFADMVYPIQALALYHRLVGDLRALQAAERAADVICQHQGPAGQWWWHYDCRTGSVLEGYPVYAVHQDAMAPMALFALAEASGRDVAEPVARGLAWLEASPELDGGSLVDRGAGLIWRKVARREPGKLSRGLQAAASRLHPRLRVPLAGALFPPGAIDYEDRPYHLGWLLHAFPAPGAAS